MPRRVKRPGVPDDLEAMIQVLPDPIRVALNDFDDLSGLLEVIMDLGRVPKARFLDHELVLSMEKIADVDIQHVIERVGDFGDDNRAGIEYTLHRISAILNRGGKPIGLTCRVGRAVYGTINIVDDLVRSGRSILLLGRPGVGKTTMLREVARVLSEEAYRRVVIVDTSNEIAGDGDIPHPAIGSSRRMQVATPALQHSVMIEAVENHMPQVIIIDEMGTEQDAAAARTIAERGVQLIATAHGNTLDNLIMNPTLADLVGGIQTVTLGDDEARRRRSQKSVLERKSPPTFDVVIEIQDWSKVAIHDNVDKVVDALLRGRSLSPEIRETSSDGHIHKSRGYSRDQETVDRLEPMDNGVSQQAVITTTTVVKVLPFGLSKSRVLEIVEANQMPVHVVDSLDRAEIVLTTKQFFRRMPKLLRMAEQAGRSIFVLRRNSLPQIREFLGTISIQSGWIDPVEGAIKEAEDAAKYVNEGQSAVILMPQIAYIRRLQHQIAEDLSLSSTSVGKDPNRRVTISRR